MKMLEFELLEVVYAVYFGYNFFLYLITTGNPYVQC